MSLRTIIGTSFNPVTRVCLSHLTVKHQKSKQAYNTMDFQLQVSQVTAKIKEVISAEAGERKSTMSTKAKAFPELHGSSRVCWKLGTTSTLTED